MIFLFLFLTHFTLYNSSGCIYLIIADSNLFLLWLIFHCVYLPKLLYPFIFQWTSRLLQCSSYCKYCCHEQWHTCVFFNFCFLRLCAYKWDCWVIWWSYFIFFKVISIPSFIMAVSIYIHIHSVRVFPFLYTFSSIYCL